MVALPRQTEPSLAELRLRRQQLEQRLTEGWRVIDQAIARGEEVRAWEERWVRLLGEYERTCDAIQAHEAGALTVVTG